MLKLPSNGMKKGMHILLAAFFVVSLTAVAASADHRGHGHGGHGHFGGHGGRGGYGGYGGWGYGGYGAGCYYMNGALVCPTYGYPYIWI